MKVNEIDKVDRPEIIRRLQVAPGTIIRWEKLPDYPKPVQVEKAPRGDAVKAYRDWRAILNWLEKHPEKMSRLQAIRHVWVAKVPTHGEPE